MVNESIPIEPRSIPSAVRCDSFLSPGCGNTRPGPRASPDRRTGRSFRGTSRPASAPCGRTPRDLSTSTSGPGPLAARPGSSQVRAVRDRIHLPPRTVQLPGERGAEHRLGMADLHPVSRSVRTAGPPRVDQPDLHVVHGDLLPEELGVDGRVERHERSAETGAECSPVSYTHLRAHETRHD